MNAHINYLVGDQGPSGGIIVFKNSTRENWGEYLEVAPIGWYGTDEDPQLIWSDLVSKLLINNSVNEIGKGRSNTIKISDKSINSAARIVLNQQINGALGWFIPSLDELNILYKSKNLTLNFEEGYYWSSSEFDAYLAWAQSFSDGFQDHYAVKTMKCFVRPIRYV
ncbi:MAG: hypothetical protein ACO3H5_02580 [Candidatus Nanopelagicales bacterium]